jgi:1-hydroxycarotenoid 3,4-desaturase
MGTRRIIVIGAGIGGLAAALDLAARGHDVTLLERAATPGGKMRVVPIDGLAIDSGPTVFTMRWVLDALFADAGLSLDAHLTLTRLGVLARHAWMDGSMLDLHADRAASADAIGRFAGAAAASGYRAFIGRAGEIYRTLETSFMAAERPSPVELARRVGVRGLPGLLRVSPFATLWDELGKHFKDKRLRQLFGRYATYCGASPFAAPATLMLIAHVEQEGVWTVAGGMHAVARAVAAAATRSGATIRYDAEVAAIMERGGQASGVRLSSGEELAAEVVIANADHAALRTGLLGPHAAAATAGTAPPRSLSAVTWSMAARPSGFEPLMHNVFFSDDYEAEFEAILTRSRLPATPTVYLCAQDRGDPGMPAPAGPERFLCLVNAPATGDTSPLPQAEIDRCASRSFDLMARAGLTLSIAPAACVTTTPSDFDRMFPGTGGALYGRALHGWAASFQRPGAATRLPGLFLAGGSVHPGPGVPMAAMSGRLAAAAAAAFLARRSASTRRSRPAGISGGTSTD